MWVYKLLIVIYSLEPIEDDHLYGYNMLILNYLIEYAAEVVVHHPQSHIQN
jgi:hypothetical protein